MRGDRQLQHHHHTQHQKHSPIDRCGWICPKKQVTTHEIKGDVYEIERLNGCTEVIVNEGYREASYVLDEALIRFGGALDDGEYAMAVSILEPLEVTPEVTSPFNESLFP